MLTKSLPLALPLALLAALSIAPEAGSAPTARAAPNAASFSDAAGDSGTAADVTDVDVGNDLVAGHIVFWVTVPNRPDSLVAGDELALFIDSDHNPSTGDLGAEYVIVLDVEGVGAYRWDGVQYAGIDPASLTAHFSKPDKAFRLAIHPNDLGIAGAFNFSLETTTGEAHDFAPNGPPDWAYTLATGRLGLSVTGSALVPRRPTAGKTLAAALLLVRNDINEVLTQGRVACTLKVGTQSVRATRAGFASGVAVCSWKLPRTAKGKLVRGTISVTFGGTTVKRSFSARAR